PPSAESSQIGRLVSWLALDSEQLAGCDIVLRSAQGLPLLAVSSTEIEGRLAVSALPLDWHRWGDLLANAVRYVALGDPRVLVWGEDDDYEPTIERALASGIALRARRDPATGVDRLSPGPVLHIDVPGSHSMPTGTRSTALSRGATVLTPSVRDRARHNTVSYTVHIGSAGYRYAQRHARLRVLRWAVLAALRASTPERGSPVHQRYSPNGPFRRNGHEIGAGLAADALLAAPRRARGRAAVQSHRGAGPT